MKLKISEIFYSLQGEGQYVGVPSIFLRTFGCNFTCGGFGMPRGQVSTERDTIAKDGLKYADYKDLPLVSTGCDSYASWDPRFKHLSPVMDIKDIIDRFQELLPDRNFNEKHLIITGGEPLLSWQRAYPELLIELGNREMKLRYLTFETNGTQPLDDALAKYLFRQAEGMKLEVTFSISAKLPCSGEKMEDAIKPEIVKDYLKIPGHKSYFKFVIANEQDALDAQIAVSKYKEAGIDIPVYLMPVGGVNSVYEMNERQVADYARDIGVRFSPRIQVPLYKNEWGT
jgi:organic radical activating enzyme